MTIQFDEKLSFGANGSAKNLLTSGFDFSELTSISWTVQSQCSLQFALPLPRADLSIEIEARPFAAEGKLREQHLMVYVNGLFVGFNRFVGHQLWSAPLPGHTMSLRPTNLVFVIPTARSPKELGLSADERVLGLAVRSICFASR